MSLYDGITSYDPEIVFKWWQIVIWPKNISMQFLVLKPWQNKKGQTFVGMLVFGMSFFEFQSPAYCKKRQVKTSIPTNIWFFLFWQLYWGIGFIMKSFFIRFCWPDEKITRDVCMNAQFQAKLGHMTTSMAIMHDIYLCKQFHRRIIDKKKSCHKWIKFLQFKTT